MMATLLFIESSPRDASSASTAIAQAFVGGWYEAHPDGTVDTLDVWDGTLPEFDGAALAGKYAALAGKDPTPEQTGAWKAIEAYAARFRAADTLLITVPLWNYSVPYKLKQLIDVVSQNGLLFDFEPDASIVGKLAGKKAVLVHARGSHYGPGSPTPAADWDQATPFMTTWLRQIGITDVESVAIDDTLTKPAETPDAIEAVSAKAYALGKRG